MQCPNCNDPLVEVDLQDLELMSGQICRKCGGCWIDKSELEGLHAGVWGNVEAMGVKVAETLSQIICPRCLIQCTEVSPEDHLELDIDRCPSCHGVWLDRGELDALYSVATDYAERHANLDNRPAHWSMMRWLTYRMALAWSRTHAGFGGQ